jgi:hypothetical protein
MLPTKARYSARVNARTGTAGPVGVAHRDLAGQLGDLAQSFWSASPWLLRLFLRHAASGTSVGPHGARLDSAAQRRRGWPS